MNNLKVSVHLNQLINWFNGFVWFREADSYRRYDPVGFAILEQF